MTRRPEKLCAQHDTFSDFNGRAVGNSRRSEPPSSHGRTSMSNGALGRPMIRDSCTTEISVGEGMASTSLVEGVDAIFRLPPHGVIAIIPRTTSRTETVKMSTWTSYLRNHFRKATYGDSAVLGTTRANASRRLSTQGS